MLVLTRKVGESIILDGRIVVKVSQLSGNRVKLCIDAPRECRIIRSEIQADVEAESEGHCIAAAPSRYLMTEAS